MNQSLKKDHYHSLCDYLHSAFAMAFICCSALYAFFAGLKTFAILIVFAIEFFLGIYLGVRRFKKNMIETKKTGIKN